MALLARVPSRLGDLSIRQKLLAIIGLVTGAALLAGFGFALRSDAEAYRREMVESSVLVARVVGDYTVPDLAFEDREAARESLAKLAAMPAVRSALILDAAGAVFATYGERVAPPAAAAAAVRFGDGGLHVVQPIVYEGERYGTLYLVASTAGLDAKIAHHRAVHGGVALLTLAVAMGLAWRLQRIVSEPIRALAETTQRVSLTGDTSLRAEKRGNDELGALCDGFNDMLSEIERRERERDAAEHRTQEKSRFLANMSHELRTPLNSIIGFSEILLGRSAELDARAQRFLANIHSSGKHLLTIINDILDLSKVEAGRMQLLPEAVSVAAVLESVATVMKGVADVEGVTLAVDAPESLPRVWADVVKVKQVFYNLLSNAVKFSPDGGEVTVTARALPAGDSPLGEDAVEVVVRDSGIGIAAADQERIFDPFQQVDSTAGRRFGGTGLGLSLVKSFVAMHGGRVAVESALGRGSAFSVVLPVRQSRQESGGEATPTPTVLVVEDDRRTFERLRPLLETVGFAPVLAKDGESALALVHTLGPAAVILDLVLPGLVDGWQVLKSLKGASETSALPIVVYSRQDNRELGLALGADDYFLKPMDLGRLVARVGELVRRGPRGGERPCVLLVDDDRAVHQLLGPGIAARGYEVAHAYTADEALQRLRSDPPALLVLDLLMAHGDGVRVAEELRADGAAGRPPLVLLAPHDPTAEERERLKGSPAAAGEPEDAAAALAELVRDLLRRRQRAAAGD